MTNMWAEHEVHGLGVAPQGAEHEPRVSAWRHQGRGGEPMILRRPIPVNCIQLLRRLEEWDAGL